MDMQEKQIKKMLDNLENIINEKYKNLKKRKQTKKLVSIVIPAFNEEKNIKLLVKNMSPILDALSKKQKYLKNQYEYEIIYINDGSTDNTWREIYELSFQNKKVKGVNFSRNFGKEIALTAGLEYSSGDIIITLDADGQHPVDKIPEFIMKWEEGYDIVYNIRPKTENASLFKTFSSKLFYFFYNKLSSFKMEEGITDYRLLDKKVVKAYLSFKETNRMYRGIVEYIGFKKTCLVFDALDRMDGGDAKYSFGKLLKLSIDALTSFSIKPLKLVLVTGFLLLIISFIGLGLFIIQSLGATTLHLSSIFFMISMNMFLIGIVLIGLGLVGIYIGSIHEEVKGRPLYIISDNLNFSELEEDSENILNSFKKLKSQIIS